MLTIIILKCINTEKKTNDINLKDNFCLPVKPNFTYNEYLNSLIRFRENTFY